MSKVISLQQKREERKLSRGRLPLHVSHLTGKVTGTPTNEELGDRMERIRNSLEKINQLMADLKRAKKDHND